MAVDTVLASSEDMRNYLVDQFNLVLRRLDLIRFDGHPPGAEPQISNVRQSGSGPLAKVPWWKYRRQPVLVIRHRELRRTWRPLLLVKYVR